MPIWRAIRWSQTQHHGILTIRPSVLPEHHPPFRLASTSNASVIWLQCASYPVTTLASWRSLVRVIFIPGHKIKRYDRRPHQRAGYKSTPMALCSIKETTMRNLLSVIALVAHLPIYALGEVFDLAGLNWTLRNENGSVSIPASIPSQVHLDLLTAGIITEPLLGINGEHHITSSLDAVSHNTVTSRIYPAMGRQ